MKLVLVRHGESIWNKENLFTGWTDVPLSDQGHSEAIQAGKRLKDAGFSFDIAYTSYLKRAISTLNHILEEMDLMYLPVNKAWQLNERHYGSLQGLNKAKTAQQYGEEQVLIWRRSYDVRPPALDVEDPRAPQNQKAYRGLGNLPLHESLEDTVYRTVPFFEKNIKKDMLKNKNVIIVAHGNSLRALVKYFENLNEKEIMSINIPTGIPLVYHFDQEFNVLDKYYLSSKEELSKEEEKVKRQGKII